MSASPPDPIDGPTPSSSASTPDAGGVAPEPTPDYSNDGVRDAIAALQAEPGAETLTALLVAVRRGHLLVDVTGLPEGTDRIRTIRSTDGGLVLPLFTSMTELALAVGAQGGRRTKKPVPVRGTLLPALDALALIGRERFVAAQFDPATGGFVMRTRFVRAALGDADPRREDVDALLGS
jgi:SseB protein N-terminal domain